MSQFFYVHPDNPQKRLISQACELIRDGAVVVVKLDFGSLHGRAAVRGALEGAGPAGGGQPQAALAEVCLSCI